MSPSAPPTLPPVERVRPGLWSVPVPIPDNPMGHVFVYVFETDRGPYIVDAGWNTEESWSALCRGLEQAGTDVGSVQGVLVTHIHPDHYGLAGRVREASGAWVALHPADAALVKDRYEEPETLVLRMGEGLAAMGAPAEASDALARAAMKVIRFVTLVRPDVLLEDGARPDVPGWDLTSIWTPGHSPGHLCFWEPRYRLLLAGDHVLPRITPNIGYHPQSGEDPLGDYLRSLAKLGPYGDADEVLPAHEHRFVGLTARLDALAAHHEERLFEVVTALEGGGATVWDVAQRMHWSRPWDRIEGFMRRAALGEAAAHLRVLMYQGMVTVEGTAPEVWRLVPGA